MKSSLRQVSDGHVRQASHTLLVTHQAGDDGFFSTISDINADVLL
jgi:hypothetical protein